MKGISALKKEDLEISHSFSIMWGCNEKSGSQKRALT